MSIVVALFVGFRAYTIALDTVLAPYFLDSDVTLAIVRGLLVLAGLGVLATAYASYRDRSLPVSIPDWTERRLIGVAVAGTAVLATLPFLLLALRTDFAVSHVVSTILGTPDLFTDRVLIRIVFFVLGMTLLYHGLLQAALQRVFDHDRDFAVGVTTLLAGYLVTPDVFSYGTFASEPWLYLWGDRAAVAVLFVLALGVAVYADERVDDGRVRALAMLPVLATLTLVVLVLAITVESPDRALVVAVRVAVVGVAAYAYESAESMTIPMLVYATFAVVSAVLYSSVIGAFVGA